MFLSCDTVYHTFSPLSTHILLHLQHANLLTNCLPYDIIPTTEHLFLSNRKDVRIIETYTTQSSLPQFIPYPVFLLESSLTLTAQQCYLLLLNRAMLSKVNNYTDENGNLYVIYPIEKLAERLNKSKSAVNSAMRELYDIGLITRKRRGFTQPNLLFVHFPGPSETLSPFSNAAVFRIRTAKEHTGSTDSASARRIKSCEEENRDSFCAISEVLESEAQKSAVPDANNINITNTHFNNISFSNTPVSGDAENPWDWENTEQYEAPRHLTPEEFEKRRAEVIRLLSDRGGE